MGQMNGRPRIFAAHDSAPMSTPYFTHPNDSAKHIKSKPGQLPAPAKTLLEAAAQRAIRHQLHQRLRLERLNSIKGGLPKKPTTEAVKRGDGDEAYTGEGDDEWDANRGLPEAPQILARAFERAFTNANEQWAWDEEVANLFYTRVLYVTPDKSHIRGKQAVIEKLNAGACMIMEYAFIHSMALSVDLSMFTASSENSS